MDQQKPIAGLPNYKVIKTEMEGCEILTGRIKVIKLRRIDGEEEGGPWPPVAARVEPTEGGVGNEGAPPFANGFESD